MQKKYRYNAVTHTLLVDVIQRKTCYQGFEWVKIEYRGFTKWTRANNVTPIN